MKSFVLFTLITLSQARFNQEQVPIDAIRKVQGGAPGVSDTIAGAAINDLLAGANPCAKLQRGDQILSELGESSDAVAAAIGMVAAEKNFNPFVTSQPSICDDPSLPQNALLRGITPRIDPAVGGADVANALSARTASSPLQADGKSVADLLSENGFTNFTVSGGNTNTNPTQSDRVDATDGGLKGAANKTLPDAGTGAPASSAATCTCTCAANNADTAKADATVPVVPTASKSTTTNRGKNEKGATASETAAVIASTATMKKEKSTTVSETAACNTASVTKKEKSATASEASTAAAKTTSRPTVNGNGTDKGPAGNNNGNANGVADFGSCDPTMSFEAGRAGRKATEFTFQSNDAVIAASQQDALNPNIITNRICDELTNICNANAAAKATCLSAKAQIQALDTKDQSTADAWNALVAGKVARRDRRRV